jgi:mannose-6-phosphate isomerase-like protein (cupin superfamily)
MRDSEKSEVIPQVLQAEEGASFWQPKPANGYVTVKASPWTVPSLSFSQGIQVIPLGSMVRRHSHEAQDEVIYCLEGVGSIDLTGKSYPMTPGATIVIPRGAGHSFKNIGEEDLKFIWTIGGPGLENFFRTIGKPRLPNQHAPDHFERPFASNIDGDHGVTG